MKKFAENHELTTIGSLKLGLYHHLISRERLARRVSNLKSQLSNHQRQKEVAKASKISKSAVKDSIKAELAETEEAFDVHAEFVVTIADKIRAGNQEQRLEGLRREIDWYKAASNQPAVQDPARLELERALHSFPNDDEVEAAKSPEELFGGDFPLRGVDLMFQGKTLRNEESDDDEGYEAEVSLEEFLQGRPCVLFDPDEPVENEKAENQEEEEAKS